MTARIIPFPRVYTSQFRKGRGFGQLGQTDALDAFAQAIQTQEGYYPGSLAYQNNNPGNLIYTGQANATLGAGGFADFDTYADGYQALMNTIQTYANQGASISSMMAAYAPAGQGSNDPTAYANTIASALGVSADTSVADAISGSVSGFVSSLTSNTGLIAAAAALGLIALYEAA